MITLLSSFHKQENKENRGLENLSNLLSITQRVSGEAEL